jgi:hypothetical protein
LKVLSDRFCDVDLTMDLDDVDVNQDIVLAFADTMVDIINEHWDIEKFKTNLRQYAEKTYDQDKGEIDMMSGTQTFEDYWEDVYWPYSTQVYRE